eukprot:756409-Rhodomonas_salina.3
MGPAIFIPSPSKPFLPASSLRATVWHAGSVVKTVHHYDSSCQPVRRITLDASDVLRKTHSSVRVLPNGVWCQPSHTSG